MLRFHEEGLAIVIDGAAVVITVVVVTVVVVLVAIADIDYW
jgi:hypothetical protein